MSRDGFCEVYYCKSTIKVFGGVGRVSVVDRGQAAADWTRFSLQGLVLPSYAWFS